MKERLAFKFYRSYFDVAKELPEKERLEFLWAILNKQFENTDTELTGLAKFAYISQEHSVKAQVQGYLDKKNAPVKGGMQGGVKGGIKGGVVTPLVQEKEKEKEKEKYNIEERKSKFYDSLSSYVSEYPKQMLRDFYDYWSEHGVNDKKMRFEKEKTFGISQRLKTWYNRNPKQYQEQTTIDPLVEYVYRKTGLR